jgi:L-threonylcarbamoyladenylate synthase
LIHQADPDLALAVGAVHKHQVIAYPTEAVFGLGCDPRSVSAVKRILSIKGREAHKGLILIAEKQEQLLEFMAPIEACWQQQFDRHWPGAVTFVVPVSNNLDEAQSALLTGGRNSIAVRVSDHPVVRKLCRSCGTALVSTSANRSGQDALLTAADVRDQFGSELSAIVDAPVGRRTHPSRIIDIKDGSILR